MVEGRRVNGQYPALKNIAARLTITTMTIPTIAVLEAKAIQTPTRIENQITVSKISLIRKTKLTSLRFCMVNYIK